MRIDDKINWEKECTGCFACLNICPKKAIDTQPSDDGFLYPLVDSDLCINCGLCQKVCGIYNNNHIKTKSADVYSAVAVDRDVRMRGSSGGMFELMARQCVDNGGIVYGAVYNPEVRGICHTSTETEPLEKLLKSKYVQSYVGDCYSEIGDHIKNGKKVLFAGTPCQVRGLKSYLEAKGIDGDITTVDFFCHGVPSPKVFSEMVEKLEKEHRILTN